MKNKDGKPAKVKKEKKQKIETPQQTDRRKSRESRELYRCLQQQGKPQYKGYLAVLLLFVVIVYIVDEFTSNVNAALQVEIVNEFLVSTGKVDNVTNGAAKLTLLSAPSYLLMVIAPFYKSLADRYGRKMFLAINTIGMGLGMFICMISTNIYVYIIGTLVITFVTPNDMQVMYIMEVAPEKHRAKLCSITKGIGLLGVTFVALLRTVYMGGDGTKWREIYLIPIIVAVVVGILAYICLRETPVFLDRRITFLKSSDEQRKEAAEKQKENDNGGLIKAVKFIFKHKQLRALAITGFIFAISTGVTLYYATIMEGGKMMSETEMTTAIFVFPFFNAFITFFSGFFMDKIGRKKTALILGVLAFVGLGMFIVSSKLGWSAILVGAMYGCFLGGLWSVSDMLFIIMAGESAPTELRASVLGAMSLFFGAGYALSMVFITIGGLFTTYLGWLCFGICMPFLLAAIILITLKVHETKGVDMSTVTGAEWD